MAKLMIFAAATERGPVMDAELEHDGSSARRMRVRARFGVVRFEIGTLGGDIRSREWVAPLSESFDLPASHRFAVHEELDPETGLMVWRLPPDVQLDVSWRNRP